MRFFFACFACLAASCGARTELAGTGQSGEAGAPCTLAPWVVFDLFGVKNGGGLAAVRADGTGFHMLDLGGERGFSPSVSPDGGSLLYITGDPEGNESLVLRDLASGNAHTVVHVTAAPPSSGLGKAAVSPDGRWIAYGDSPDVHLAKLDGSGDHVLVSGPYDEGCCSWSYGRPQFSGDSSLIYFSTIGRLESIHTDGSARQLLYQDQFFANPSIEGFVFPNVSLSPDKTKLVAQVACDASALRIFDVAALPADPCVTGTKLVETGVSLAPNEASNASWGPTNLLAYDDDKDVFVIDASGGAKTNLTASFTTESGASASDPVWAPGCSNLP